MSDKPNGRYVTNAELDDRLDKIPTRWEVRFLIVVALIGTRLIPAGDLANAAIHALPH